jgi:large subunit ribosomal protein L23
MNVFKVLRRPIVTEKSTLLQENHKYVFEIHDAATKPQVREAVERAFEVNVVSVNIVRTHGEVRRFGASGRRALVGGSKKAIVTLAPDQHIQFFEGT